MCLRLSLFLLVALLSLPATAQEVEVSVLATIESSAISEASGIVFARRTPGVMFVHNDSGDKARLYAVNLDGELLATFSLRRPDGTVHGATDIEDLAVAPDPVTGMSHVFMADFGDNFAQRPFIKIHRFVEPIVNTSARGLQLDITEFETIELTYSDGPRDAEAMMVSPRSGSIYVVSKSSDSALYRTGYPYSSQNGTLVRQWSLGIAAVTAADVSPSGNDVLIKTYGKVYLFHSGDAGGLRSALSADPVQLPYIPEPQGESIGWSAGGDIYVTLSEGAFQPIYGYQMLSILTEDFESALYYWDEGTE